MTNYHDAIIAGGGVPGLVLAALLGRAGLSVMLVDAQSPCPPLKDVKPDGRTAALIGQSIDRLARAGVWPLLKDHGAALIRMAVVDDSRFPGGADAMVEQMFDAAELDREAFGWNLPLSAMRAALTDVLKQQKNITHLTGTTVADFTVARGAVDVRLDNGHAHPARLLVGCDGRNSVVREKSGIVARRRAYGQSAITCLVRHSQSHDNTSTEFHRPGGPFTIVPMTGDMSAIVWVEIAWSTPSRRLERWSMPASGIDVLNVVSLA